MNVLLLVLFGSLPAFAASQHQETEDKDIIYSQLLLRNEITDSSIFQKHQIPKTESSLDDVNFWTRVLSKSMNTKYNKKYPLTIDNGSGGTYNEYLPESKVEIEANCNNGNFAYWMIGYGDDGNEDVEIDNKFAAKTVVTMPAEETTVVAYCQGRHELEVINGFGSGPSYLAESKVNIFADCDPKYFRKWHVLFGDPEIKDVSAAETELVMPNYSTKVSAQCKGYHNLDVKNGNGSGYYRYDSKVDISANCPARNFRQWIVNYGSPNIEDMFNVNTKLTMTSQHIGIRASCEGLRKYNLNVITGTKDSISEEHEPGDKIEITAGCDFEYFRGWFIEYGSPEIDDIFSGKTIITMPSEDVRVRAYCEFWTFELDVKKGRGDGFYLYDEDISISADPAPSGKKFDKWKIIKGRPMIEDMSKQDTILQIVKQEDVIIIAKYSNEKSKKD